MDDSAVSKLFDQVLKAVGIPGFILVPGAVLFVPDGWLDRIGLLKARNDHKMWFGLALLLGVAMLIKVGGSLAWTWTQELRQRRKKRRELDNFIRLMETLDETEHVLLINAHLSYFGDAAPPLDELTQKSSWAERERVQNHLLSLGLLEFSAGLGARHIQLTKKTHRLMKGYAERSFDDNVQERIKRKP